MDDPFIIAHRGASHDAPENTIAAFREAWKQGADSIEADLRMTLDRKIVCIHDAKTKRVASRHLVVADSTLEELRALDVGIWKGPIWRGERIPLIDEVFDLVPPDKHIVIEVKCGREILPVLDRALEASDFSVGQITVISFDEHFIEAFKCCHPSIPARWITDLWQIGQGLFVPGRAEILRTLKRCRANGLSSFGHTGMTPDFIACIRDAGYEYHAWTIDDPEWARRLLEIGAQSITTNEPGRIRASLLGRPA